MPLQPPPSLIPADSSSGTLTHRRSL
uniref:Uncharacterized protein n=1 Tax=Rhizophora mucronata TaxID=61149 RepID=A0A2P2Q7W1_RHIMU